MMCSDLRHLQENLRVLEAGGVEYLHIDIMDGAFVPNLGLGMDYLRNLRAMTDIPMDIHLMVNRPEEKLAWLGLLPQDVVSIHYESTRHIQRCVQRAKETGCKVFVAINPGTPVWSLEEILNCIDGVNMLTVNPGFPGQKMVSNCMGKAKRLRAFLQKCGFGDLALEVDGNISVEHARTLRELGANVFVAGTSSIFPDHGIALPQKLQLLKECIR